MTVVLSERAETCERCGEPFVFEFAKGHFGQNRPRGTMLPDVCAYCENAIADEMVAVDAADEVEE